MGLLAESGVHTIDFFVYSIVGTFVDTTCIWYVNFRHSSKLVEGRYNALCSKKAMILDTTWETDYQMQKEINKAQVRVLRNSLTRDLMLLSDATQLGVGLMVCWGIPAACA